METIIEPDVESPAPVALSTAQSLSKAKGTSLKREWNEYKSQRITKSPRNDRDASSMKPWQDLNNRHAKVDAGKCMEPTSRYRTIGN